MTLDLRLIGVILASDKHIRLPSYVETRTKPKNE